MPVLGLGKSKRLDFSIFKGKVFVHCNDFMKQKNVTFNVDELAYFFSLREKIERRVKKLSQHLKKKKKRVDSSDDDDSSAGEEKRKKKRKAAKVKQAKLEKMGISSDDDDMSE